MFDWKKATYKLHRIKIACIWNRYKEEQVLESGRDDESIFMFDAYGLSLEQFNSYVKECKNLGYTIDSRVFEGFYSADNEDGYNVYLYYNEGDERMSGTVESLEE